MRKFVLFAALAGVALVGCTKNEVLPSLKAEKEISFSSPIVGLNTKVNDEISSDYNTDESFVVWAVHHAGDLITWGDAKAYMGTKDGAGVTVSYDSTHNTAHDGNGGWHASEPYYWPKVGKLSFAAASPASVLSAATYGAAGLVVPSFEVSESKISNQVDLLYAERTLNKTTSNYDTSIKYDGVDIKFKHALSKIKFTAMSGLASNSPIKLILKKIEVVGVNSVGKFQENVTDRETYSSAPAWTDTTTKKTYVAWEGVDTLKVGTASGLSGNGLMLIPQNIPGAAQIKVTYTVKSGSTEIEGNESTATLSGTWAVGTCYTYNLTVSLEEIYFAPSVSAWRTEASSAVDVSI